MKTIDFGFGFAFNDAPVEPVPAESAPAAESSRVQAPPPKKLKTPSPEVRRTRSGSSRSRTSGSGSRRSLYDIPPDTDVEENGEDSRSAKKRRLGMFCDRVAQYADRDSESGWRKWIGGKRFQAGSYAIYI